MSQPTYILPSSTVPFPNGLNLRQFIQSVLVGISGLPGTLVRPRWQLNPPKQPDVDVNWLAYGITEGVPDANGYSGMNQNNQMESQRHQELRILCAFYGPDCSEYAGIVRDGFQMQTNLQGLTQANMGFVSTGNEMHVPDLIHERWVDRIEMEVILRRQIQRIYPVPFVVSAHGEIRAVLTESDNYIKTWQTPEETT